LVPEHLREDRDAAGPRRHGRSAALIIRRSRHRPGPEGPCLAERRHQGGGEQFYRDLETDMAAAQRAGKKGRAMAIHAKISNRGQDFLPKLSSDLVRMNRVIIVGNVNASALTRTSMAKAVLDTGGSTFRTVLQYKSSPFGDCVGSVI